MSERDRVSFLLINQGNKQKVKEKKTRSSAKGKVALLRLEKAQTGAAAANLDFQRDRRVNMR